MEIISCNKRAANIDNQSNAPLVTIMVYVTSQLQLACSSWDGDQRQMMRFIIWGQHQPKWYCFHGNTLRENTLENINTVIMETVHKSLIPYSQL